MREKPGSSRELTFDPGSYKNSYKTPDTHSDRKLQRGSFFLSHYKEGRVLPHCSPSVVAGGLHRTRVLRRRKEGVTSLTGS